ncbi:MAG: hypothetical protein CVV64_18790 [Candidatus Wallbacteria bacterium HGW-Wallbacteria-1]|jgi:DNA-binding transcriptional MerR regulator|uniref:HTH merR-type domain-containing protein n=1 Tax=Candidatus Wallbacteria bacterium HGW-Wallbacteria-1 TaxID=2013854 RepID=A0A2N1PJC6_9BACT|nr:MAG: hypothetical protein CVV64_18790 [Candidatus Wallbacteria bacterium HGW-Wallbacteria-1]
MTALKPSVFRTIDLARAAGVHVNTVRFYERIGFLSPVDRDDNGYRRFDHRHLLQIRIIRCVYAHGWFGRRIREASDRIISHMVAWRLDPALDAADDYVRLLQAELNRATLTADILQRWAQRRRGDHDVIMNFSQAARETGVTVEVLRNWERNGLIEIPREGPNRKRVFSRYELERLGIIYLLRQARFSMASILSSLAEYDRGGNAGLVRSALDDPENCEDATWICVGERWIAALQSGIGGGFEIAALIREHLNQKYANQKHANRKP